MSNGLEYYDLENAPLVRVYKNLLPNLDKIINLLKDSENNPKAYNAFSSWQKWNNLGTMVPASLSNYNSISDIDNFYNVVTEEHLLLKQIYDAYFIALQDYKTYHKIDFEIKELLDGPCFYKYDHTLSAPLNKFPQFSMNYHTDFVFSLKDNPGKKPVLTCTIYFNDDYAGGEVIFNVERRLSRPYYDRREQFSDDELPIANNIIYKPAAGDVIIFPSGNPDYLSDTGYYFHCVNRVMHKNKYFASFFYSYEDRGSKYWNDGIEEYGEDLWIWLEKRRVHRSGYRKKAVSLND